MLSVSKHNITNVSNTKTIYQNCSCVNLIYHFCAFIAKLQNIS